MFCESLFHMLNMGDIFISWCRLLGMCLTYSRINMRKAVKLRAITRLILKFGRVKWRIEAIKHTRTCFVNSEQSIGVV